jgi:branched-chain amino acid transport system substrate-binding protein
MGNALGDGLHPGLLKGMKGTYPFAKQAATFVPRLQQQDPTLKDYNYGGEAYDAVIVTALAAEQAKSTRGVDIASQINEITKDGEKCINFRRCKEIIDRGGNPDYDGVSGPLDFTSPGEPGAGSYAVLQFDAQNQVPKIPKDFILVGLK